MSEKSIKTRKPSRKARLVAARLTAVQCVYEMAISSLSAREVYDHYVNDLMNKPVEGDNYVPADLTLLSAIINGVSGERDNLRDMALGALNGKKPEPLIQSQTVMFMLWSVLRVSSTESLSALPDRHIKQHCSIWKPA